MSEFKRKQGRPTRAEGSVGKTKIICLTQDLLRSDPHVDLSRKVVAQHIGVTPALITYYFPKSTNLLEAVVYPIMDDYAKRLRSILNYKCDKLPDVREVIDLLVELYTRDGRSVSIYKEIYTEDSGGNALDEMHTLLAEYMTARDGGEEPRSFEAAVLQSAVQGMCDFVARTEASRSTCVPPAADNRTDWIDRLQAFLVPVCQPRHLSRLAASR